MLQQNEKITALYCRLSQEDELAGDTSKKIKAVIMASAKRGERIGTTVNYRSFHPSFKKKKSKQNPPEKWLRFENTHEPIIDTET